MKVTCVEWPDGLVAGSPVWQSLLEGIVAEQSDLLITNEMPFGPWLASAPCFDAGQAQRSIDLHAAGLEALVGTGIPMVISSRPVWEGDRLANEAVVIRDGHVEPLHRKQFFPDEPGWYEAKWFKTSQRDFTAKALGPVSVGMLLCTEAMFNEHARSYGVQGAGLIALPRATGTSQRIWQTAGAMAAIASGAYVISSNRVGGGPDGPVFGGGCFAYAPDGELIGTTNHERPFFTVEVDPARAAAQQRDGYPCYVARAAAEFPDWRKA